MKVECNPGSLLLLGLCIEYLNPCEWGNLLAFKDSSTLPYEIIDLSLSFGDGKKNKRIVKICFLVIPCESVYNGILKKLFLDVLEAVAFTVHLKMKYYKQFESCHYCR